MSSHFPQSQQAFWWKTERYWMDGGSITGHPWHRRGLELRVCSSHEMHVKMHIYHLVEPVLTPSMSSTAVWSVALRFYPCSIISGSTPRVKEYKRPVKSKSGGGYGGQMVQTKDFPARVRGVTKCQSCFALNLCYMHMIHTYVSYGSLIHVQPLHNVTQQFKTSLISPNGVLIAHQYLKSFCVLSQHIFCFSIFHYLFLNQRMTNFQPTN